MSNGQPPGPGQPPQGMPPQQPGQPQQQQYQQPQQQQYQQPQQQQQYQQPQQQQYQQPQQQQYQQQQPMAPSQSVQRPHAQPPQGSMAQPNRDEVLYEGIARHSANIGAYLKWLGVSFLGAGAAFGLNMIEGVSTSPAGPWLWAASAIGLPGLLWAYLVHVNRKYKINRKRVETETGVLAKSVDSLELWRVLDIQYNQSLLDRIFSNAKISLIGTDQSDPVLVLHGMPNHRKLFEELREAIQLARHTSRPMELVPGQDMDGGMGGMGEFVG